jgi:extracellular factor (EF) 3-hydroxypalmitic acid methyl ester biosynthesis protein
LVVGTNSQGLEIRGTLRRLSRYQAAFEVYQPGVVLRLSEVLSDCKIVVEGQPVYTGRAVLSGLVNAGSGLVCEANLEDRSWTWQALVSHSPADTQPGDFGQFLRQWRRSHQVRPEFKLVVADLQVFLLDLRQWLEQSELEIGLQSTGDYARRERERLLHLQDCVLPPLRETFERFEDVCSRVEPGARPAHSSYVKRQLHPLVLCAPFMHRAYRKPLGFAGDYEMVNMMVRDPFAGDSLFAKILNRYFLDTPPVVAHRNRLQYLSDQLVREACRVARFGRPLRMFNLGCGPAVEVQAFLRESELSHHADFTLVDFNDETLAYTSSRLQDIQQSHRRRSTIRLQKLSVAQLLKEAGKPGSGFCSARYDVVCCAGLFDYLPNQVCERLTSIFYQMLAPDGLMLVTNVDGCNPSRNWMEYAVDWNLVYRDRGQMEALAPSQAPTGSMTVVAEITGLNHFLRVRKPYDV